MNTFAELERQGWNDRASIYGMTTATATMQAVPALLDAAEIRAGHRLLDISTGPGYAAAAAGVLGCDVTGIDFAEDMVAEAARQFAGCRFETGDAQALPFDDAAFDRVVCNFGVFHFEDPDRALSEAARVTAPDGVFAWSHWHGPERSPLFAALFGAVTRNADMDIGLPPAPPPFRLSDPNLAREAMSAAGFRDVRVRDIPIALAAPSSSFLDYFRKFAVRTAMILDRQSPAVLERIEQEVCDGLTEYRQGDEFVVPMPAMIVSGRRPN